MSASYVASWMMSELEREGLIYQETIVCDIDRRFGDQFTCTNERGHLAISEDVLAAFVCDAPAAALPSIDLLEYPNTQLLEFRYYDEVLTRLLADVYQRLEKKRSFFSRWRLAREAEHVNTIRLDIRELSELTDNAIKFLSDMFYARVYRLAANRVGVTDYHNLVAEKLETAEDLYDSMVNEFHQARAFVLELMVVIILLVEIVMVFRGKG